MNRVARLMGLVTVMIGLPTACADQGLVQLHAVGPAAGVPTTANQAGHAAFPTRQAVGPAAGVPTVMYNADGSAPLCLPPPPSAWHTPVVAAPAGPVVAAPAAPVITYRPLLPVIPAPGQYYLGRGVLGQPKLYVPNQPVRNFVRYLSP